MILCDGALSHRGRLVVLPEPVDGGRAPLRTPGGAPAPGTPREHDDCAMTSVHDIIELDTRTTDGIDVRLLWHSAEDRVSVTAHDVRSGETVEVEVRDHERALAVFHHPYAYAAFHGVEPHAEEPRFLTPALG
jgi:hypothetical protein